MEDKGFTLIELLVVFSVLIMLSAIGFASFVTYSRTQAVNSAVNDVAAAFFSARSKAMSQVKPNSGPCLTPPPPTPAPVLNGYRVSLCPSGCSSTYDYELKYGCNDVWIVKERKRLPQNVSFGSPLTLDFTFRALQDTVAEAASEGTEVVIQGYGLTRKVIVYQDGRIGVR